MKKSIKLSLFLLSIAININFLLATSSNPQMGIAAIVNNQMISKAQLDQRIKLAIISSNMPDTPQIRQQLMPQILSVMIDELIQLQLGATYNIKIDQAALDHALHAIESQNNMPAGGLKKLLTAHQIPLEAMYSHLKANIIWRDYIRERYKENVQISDEEVARAVAEQQAAKNTDRVDLYELVISHKAEKHQASYKDIQKIIDLLKKGAPFPVLAQQFSSSTTANRGGHLGWIRIGTLDDKTSHAIKHLHAGEISHPVTTEMGTAIYYVKERLSAGESQKPEVFLTFKQVLLPHPKGAFEFEVRENMNRAKAMARTIKGCRVVDKITQNNDITAQTVTHVPISNLPPELNKILSNLAIDQASAPVLTQEGALFFVLCDKETLNPQEPSVDEIREQLLEQKLQLIAEREMRSRRKSAHIERRLQ